jgi:hypothetical protein
MDLNHQHQLYNAMFCELKFLYMLLYIVSYCLSGATMAQFCQENGLIMIIFNNRPDAELGMNDLRRN